MRIRLILVPAVALTFMLAGCGSSKKVAAPATTTTTMSTTTTTAAPDPVKDKATAQKLVLVKADIPSGWTESAPDADTAASQAADDQVNKCIGMPPTAQTQIADVNGDDFAQGNNSIGSEVDSLKSTQLVQQDLSGSTDPKNFPCVAGVINAQVTQSLSSTAATASSTIANLDGVTSGNNQFALRVTTAVKGAAGTINVYTDLLGLRDGRFEISDTVSYTGTTPPVSLEKALLAAEVQHVGGTTLV